MNEYLIRNATIKDIPFLADVVIAAEKGISDKLSFSTLFNLSENEARDLIIAMIEEEIDGCELSLSSFLIAEYNGEAVAASGAWIEGFDGAMPSQILKSNLISYLFKKESVEFLQTKSYIVKDILISREPLTLQFEYMHITEMHLGKGLDVALVRKNEENALVKYPALQKAQCQLFKNNIFAIKMAAKKGFKIIKSFKSGNSNILDYLSFDEKLLMEKNY
ncbi:MAG: hypothetical protein RIS73_696 [Bacteroidota bacterium]